MMSHASGRFCANLRRRLLYRLRDDEVECFCAALSSCEAFLEVTDPEASGMCTDADPLCEDVGTVELFCDFFCGS